MIEYKTMQLIHYGADHFDPDKFKPIKNRDFVKPEGGLWASPVDSEYGWREWCEAEKFNEEKLEIAFQFEYTGRFLVINSQYGLGAMCWREVDYWRGKLVPDFELMAIEIDAIHLTARGQAATRWSQPDLYGWDCESVLIMNPEGIVVYA